VEVLI
jgi:hypothetical protein